MSDQLKAYLTRKFGDFLSDERKATIDHVLANRTSYLRVVMEDFVDSHNVNAVFRTGECLGVQDFHIIDNAQRFHIGRGVSKGSSKWINIHRHDQEKVNNSLLLVNQLKKEGFKIVVSSPVKNATSIQSLEVSQPIALILGNEKEGVSNLLLNEADEIVTIPMYGFTESFNVSVAAALLIQTIMHKIRSEVVNWQLDKDLIADYKFQWYKKSMARPDYYQNFFVNAYELEKNR